MNFVAYIFLYFLFKKICLKLNKILDRISTSKSIECLKYIQLFSSSADNEMIVRHIPQDQSQELFHSEIFLVRFFHVAAMANFVEMWKVVQKICKCEDTIVSSHITSPDFFRTLIERNKSRNRYIKKFTNLKIARNSQTMYSCYEHCPIFDRFT